MRGVFEQLRPRLKSFRDEKGRELFDLPRAPRPDPELTPAVRLIPDFDNILLAHADRTRIMPEGRHLGMFSSNGVMQGAVLVDGYVRAMWRPQTLGASTRLLINAFTKPLSRSEQEAIGDEAHALLEFLAPNAKNEIEFGPTKP